MPRTFIYQKNIRSTMASALLLGLIVMLSMCRKAEPFPTTDYDQRLSGGMNTVFDATSKAFGNPFPSLSGHNLSVHSFGDQKFGSSFVASPAPVNPGLGPLFNNVGCTACHHNDGIGLPTAGDAQSSLLVRISMASGTDEHGGPAPVPGYGLQLHDKAILGIQPQCTIHITYSYQTYTFADGTSYELRTPTYTCTNLYTAIMGAYALSPRLAPPVFGLGMLEAVPESGILANADPNDANGDGISGRANYVWDPIQQNTVLGRFGLKANTASVLTQVAAAYVNDMGVTNKIFPQENCVGMPQCNGATGNGTDLPDSVLTAVQFYVQTLAVPARRNVTDAAVVQGKKIFIAAKCVNCHVETLTTATDVAFPPLSHQQIHPYTDLLLHDMGAGLADGRADYLATGQEWRTTPLWGVGLFASVNYPAYFLHDGRARTLTEAVMWHGGEAQQSVNYVRQLSTSDRNALLTFLGSL